jgi:hypothetical protein
MLARRHERPMPPAPAVGAVQVGCAHVSVCEWVCVYVYLLV